MIKFKSLKQKVALLIILPLCLVMLLAGTLGMQLISKFLLHQWEETAISKMERSAHNVDMRLMRPKDTLLFFQQGRKKQLSRADTDLLIDQLQNIDGVVEVKFNSTKVTKSDQHTMVRMHVLQNTSISPLVYNTELKGQTVSIVAKFIDITGAIDSRIEVVVAFDDLVDQIVKAPWWKGNEAYIIDQDGVVLASTELSHSLPKAPGRQRRVFGQTSTVEAETWKAIQKKKSGTVFSPGIPPDMVSGFYRLTEAPWTLVVMAAGSSVLQPIITFRNYYILICSAGIICVALYLWLFTSKVTRSINRMSIAATRLAQGTFDTPLAIESNDEIGNLTNSFNIMSKQLKERLELRQEMSLAGEVQTNLLPQIGFTAPGLEIAVLSKYCDETGGDYVDILKTSYKKKRATVVVGDVVGHGIGAALLMTTLRALLRCRASMPGSQEDIIRDVNGLLCDDTLRFGNFATLFYLQVDRSLKTLTWVRCGHEPALIFSPETDSFKELKGKGIALGLQKDFEYTSNHLDFIDKNQIILVGTDGIWEVQNNTGEYFGKKRTKILLAKFSSLSARKIADKILEEVEKFCGPRQQGDDITLAVIKTITDH